MNNITEHIQNRRSVRTFDGRKLSKADIEKLASFAQTIENPYKIRITYKEPIRLLIIIFIMLKVYKLFLMWILKSQVMD